MALKRALTLQNIADAKVERYPFTGEWYEAFGNPQSTGVWFLFGGSGSGKTSFILQLLKKIAEFDNIIFESYEEGKISGALQDGIARFGLLQINKKVLVATESLEELTERLSKRGSPRVVFLDSLEYSEFRNLKQIVDFTGKYPKKLFVIIGQADGKKPSSKLGERVLFHANQKFYVEGYRAFTRGRSFGDKNYLTVWQKGAREYWID